MSGERFSTRADRVRSGAGRRGPPVENAGPPSSDVRTVVFRKVTRENWRDVIALDIRPDQYRFLAPHAGLYALAKAYVYPERQHLAIRIDGQTVGFLSAALLSDREPACVDVQAFFIDLRYQGRGYGRAAMAAFLHYAAQTYPAARRVQLSVSPDNGAALRMYRSLGFDAAGAVSPPGNDVHVRDLPAARPAPAARVPVRVDTDMPICVGV